MKKWHFDNTKSYIETFNVAYVKIKELEAKKEDTKRDEREEEDVGKKEDERKGGIIYL